MKVRQYKQRTLRPPRNPVALALRAKRGGEHRKTAKALRRAANTALTRGLKQAASDE